MFNLKSKMILSYLVVLVIMFLDLAPIRTVANIGSGTTTQLSGRRAVLTFYTDSNCRKNGGYNWSRRLYLDSGVCYSFEQLARPGFRLRRARKFRVFCAEWDSTVQEAARQRIFLYRGHNARCYGQARGAHVLHGGILCLDNHVGSGYVFIECV
jgi:hypothetical protein